MISSSLEAGFTALFPVGRELRKVWHVIYDLNYSDVIMSEVAYQITGVAIVYSTVCSGTDQTKYQSSVSLDFMRGIHRGPVNSPQKSPVAWKVFSFDDVIMVLVISIKEPLPWSEAHAYLYGRIHCWTRLFGAYIRNFCAADISLYVQWHVKLFRLMVQGEFLGLIAICRIRHCN